MPHHEEWPHVREVRARLTDPETSHAAAKSITEDKLRISQAAVLYLFRIWREPMDDVLVASRYDEQTAKDPWVFPRQSVSGLRTRRDELVTAGFLEDSGERVKMKSGRKAIVWRLTPKGDGSEALLAQNLTIFDA